MCSTPDGIDDRDGSVLDFVLALPRKVLNA